MFSLLKSDVYGASKFDTNEVMSLNPKQSLFIDLLLVFGRVPKRS